MCSGLALRIVHKYEAVFLIKTELVGPAPGVIGAAVSTPRGSGSAGGGPGPVAAAAGLAGSVLRILTDTGLFRFRITAVFILGLLPWVKHWETRDGRLISQGYAGPCAFCLLDGRHNDNRVYVATLYTVRTHRIFLRINSVS